MKNENKNNTFVIRLYSRRAVYLLHPVTLVSRSVSITPARYLLQYRRREALHLHALEP